jgi:D-lactate dehydrogenase
MNIAFFELEGWERPVVTPRLEGHRVFLCDDALSPSLFSDVADCEIVSPFIYSRIDRRALDAMPSLKLVVTRSTGHDHIDVEECRARGIAVSTVPEYGSQTVAEHSFALILALSRRLIKAYQAVHSGMAKPETAQTLRGFDLRGKTLGVVGAGNIGLHMVRMARSFGMRVLVHDPIRRQTLADLLDFEYVTLESLLHQSDIVSLHCPASPATHHMINRESLAIMKRGALLVNTARGELVDTADLLFSLQSGQIGGAGLDVFEGEALVREEAQILSKVYDREQLESAIHAHQLLKRDDVIVTPHNAFNSVEAVTRILETTLSNIHAFLAGSPQNTVQRRQGLA